jgi:hypothetical protein
MPVFLIGLMLVSTANFLIGLGGRLRRLTRGGNIGINQLVLNEGRTIRSNGNCGPCQLNEELSPVAQAVRQAFTEISPAPANEIAVVALRAAVNEVAPEKTIEDIDYVHQSYVDGYKDALYEILNLVDELEAR